MPEQQTGGSIVTPTEFCETRVLPVIVAFGCGVLAMGYAIDYREAQALGIARRAVAIAEEYRDACGPIWPPAELPGRDLQKLAEARP
jgi:hypothetical protein